METADIMNDRVVVARRIVRVVRSCRTEAQLETARRYVMLAGRRYRADFLPLMGLWANR